MLLDIDTFKNNILISDNLIIIFVYAKVLCYIIVIKKFQI